jgi:hypothetical protein
MKPDEEFAIASLLKNRLVAAESMIFSAYLDALRKTQDFKLPYLEATLVHAKALHTQLRTLNLDLQKQVDSLKEAVEKEYLVEEKEEKNSNA